MKTIESARTTNGDTIPTGPEWRINGAAERHYGARQETDAPISIRMDIILKISYYLHGTNIDDIFEIAMP